MPGRTQSREAWEGEKERAGRGPALTWGGTAGPALTLPSAVACLPTRSQPPLPGSVSRCTRGRSAWSSPWRVLTFVD